VIISQIIFYINLNILILLGKNLKVNESLSNSIPGLAKKYVFGSRIENPVTLITFDRGKRTITQQFLFCHLSN